MRQIPGISATRTPSRYAAKRDGILRRQRVLRCDPLESRDLLSGVTLITHGFNGNVDGWITEMASAIAARPDITVDQPQYRVEVFDSGAGTPIELTASLLTTPGPTDPAVANPEIAVLLNWTPLAGTVTTGGGYTRSTVDIAAAVAQKLVQPGFFPGMTTPLAELPFHLIGHSRGASLVGELAYNLGLQGIWVDQVTTFDPHPVDGVREPPLANYDFGDAGMTAWENVVFWDNYWRTEGDPVPFFSLDFTGEPIEETHDVQLVESVLADGGYDYEHSDVHAWYHGTIDTSSDPPANNGDFDIPNAWYGGAHPDRNASGYHFSRVVNGARPAEGLSAAVGGTAVRTALPSSGLTWPNLFGLQVTDGDLSYSVGDSLSASLYHQDADSGATISFYLDGDRNPYDANETEVDSLTVTDVTATPTMLDVTLPTTGISEGDYYLGAKISDTAGHTRYAYAPDMITLTGSPVANLEGTPEDDTIVVSLGVPGGESHIVDVNSNIFTFDPTVVSEIHIDGLGGNDTITILATDQNETVTVTPGSVDVLAQSYQIHATSVETITVKAGTGDDTVTMAGSTASQRLYSYADYAILTDSTRSFRFQAEGFDTMNVDIPAGGRNSAYLYDSSGMDRLDADPQRVVIRRGVVGAAAESMTTVTGFQRVYGFGTQGDGDEAVLVGADTTSNRFYGYGSYAVLTESLRSFYFYARGFDAVTGESPGSGYSYAYLHDSPGDDSLVASPGSATMDRAASWTDTTATGFARLYAYSRYGGTDTAELTGSGSGGN